MDPGGFQKRVRKTISNPGGGIVHSFSLISMYRSSETPGQGRWLLPMSIDVARGRAKFRYVRPSAQRPRLQAGAAPTVRGLNVRPDQVDVGS